MEAARRRREIAWGKLTEDEFLKLEGDQQKLTGLVQERYERQTTKMDTQFDSSTAAPTPVASPNAAHDAIVLAFTGRLIGLGWKMVEPDAQTELQCFEHLLPAADRTFTMSYPGADERCPVAFHFTAGENALRYACTVRGPGGIFIQEHGRLDFGTGSLIVESTRGDWNVVVAPVADANPASVARPALRVKPIRGSTSAPLALTSKPNTAAPTIAPGFSPSGDIRAQIIAAVAATGTYVCLWSILRRSTFPGPDGWRRLQAWCADHRLESELCFGGSSKNSEVQFRQRRSANRIPVRQLVGKR